VGFAPLDDTGAQLLFVVVAAAYERRSLGIASHWPFDQWGRFLPEHTTAVSLLDRLLHHASVVVTNGDSYRMREARAKGGTTPEKELTNPRGGDFHLATSGDHHHLTIDNRCPTYRKLSVARAGAAHRRTSGRPPGKRNYWETATAVVAASECSRTRVEQRVGSRLPVRWCA
jgi:hypothetical protein